MKGRLQVAAQQDPLHVNFAQGDDFAGIDALHISSVTDFGPWIVDTVHGRTPPMFLSSYPSTKRCCWKETQTRSQHSQSSSSPSLSPRQFWGKCVLTAAYLINHLPSSNLHWQSPYEILHHKKPSLDHIRIFGCLCYATNVNPNKHKFDPRASNCIFIGYSQNHKGYKLYHQDNKIVFTSRDVLFNEDVFPLANVSAIPTSYLPTAIPDPIPSHVPPMNSHAPTPSPTTVANPPIVPSISAPTPPSPALRQANQYVHRLEAMVKELEALKKNGTWNLIELLAGKKVVGSRWVYKVKLKQDGSIERYKARLVAKGYTQVEGVDYFDSFSPMAKTVTIFLLPSSSSVSSSNFLINLIRKLPFTCLLENKETGDFGVPVLSPIPFYCNNKAAIHITKNLIFHERTKHLDIDCHLVPEHFKQGFILPSHIFSPQQPVDQFTKALPAVPFARLLSKLGLISHEPT
ncbi:Retrovirus-related Pol polyprotein from transposon RE2 [Sesamum angolense]|uniref:Retrovirus-related Pol polyprotein from transposon RE2 n=1 Tax=Sesamum angolense TaxID=2727404 RepID=A0AAE1W7T6_9LAMI|nr:Retrovirus-related Pol polyprotein from transposon RE2 [Sesamum angolense]